MTKAINYYKTFFMLTLALVFGTIGTILMFTGEPITFKMLVIIFSKLLGAALFVLSFIALRRILGLHRM